jgi:hypothetical protein
LDDLSAAGRGHPMFYHAGGGGGSAGYAMISWIGSTCSTPTSFWSRPPKK